MSAPGPAATPRPPGRALLRVAGVLSQLSCGVCLLIGTIGLVLVQQHKTGDTAAVVVWLVTAMAGLVFGGLIYRGGVISMVVAAAIDAGFGVVLIAIEYDTLRKLLKILPASDVGAIGDALNVAGFTMAGAGALCLVAIPQGVRFARWFRDAAATRTAMSTARGFPPPPVPAYSSVFIIPAEEAPASRRRLYMVLGGLAIGVGAGVGVLVSAPRTVAAPSRDGTAKRAAPGRSTAGGQAGQAGAGTGSGSSLGSAIGPDANRGVAHVTAVSHDPADVGSGAAAADPPGPAGRMDVRAADNVHTLLIAQRAALAKADPKALAALVAPSVFAFGLDAAEVAEGRDAVTTQLIVDLGEMPASGFAIASTALSIGQERNHAWIAEELQISAAGRASRTLAISELAAVIGGKWQIVALHWASPVTDATAQRRAILKTMPTPAPITDRHDGSSELDRAVRAAFATRAAFAGARSERPDAFNYGSGGERATGGAAIKRIFTKLKAQIRVHDGTRVADASAWDPAQRAAPWIGWAAVNVDFTARTRAATDVTQTFRVLAVMLKEGADWKIVQTQWSNGGPIR